VLERSDNRKNSSESIRSAKVKKKNSLFSITDEVEVEPTEKLENS